MAFGLLLVCVSMQLSFLQALSVHFRQATAKDVSAARKILFSEAMNPLSVSEATLLVASSDGATDRSVNDDMVGFGQIRRLNDDYSELASLYVLPSHRKRGIGTALVQELLERYENSKDSSSGSSSGTAAAATATCTDSGKVCLLTLAPTVPFYEPHGFVVVEDTTDLPTSVQFEIQAGSAISKFLGNQLVCMVRDP